MRQAEPCTGYPYDKEPRAAGSRERAAYACSDGVILTATRPTAGASRAKLTPICWNSAKAASYCSRVVRQ